MQTTIQSGRMKQARQKIQSMIDIIKGYGVSDSKVLNAFEKIPRHKFVSYEYVDVAYDDSPLPIGHGQTISQPYTVAMMLEELMLENGHNVLEIGAGSGWNAALIKEIVGSKGRVTAVEYIEELAVLAKENLRKVLSDVRIVNDDGSLGYKPYAPYDRIIVTCACPEIPPPLIRQLKDRGIIIAPVGRLFQQMIRGKKEDGELSTESLGSFRFVPLKGKYGF